MYSVSPVTHADTPDALWGESPTGGGDGVALLAQLQGLRQQKTMLVGRLAFDSPAFKKPANLFSAEPRHVGKATRAVTPIMEIRFQKGRVIRLTAPAGSSFRVMAP